MPRARFARRTRSAPEYGEHKSLADPTGIATTYVSGTERPRSARSTRRGPIDVHVEEGDAAQQALGELLLGLALDDREHRQNASPASQKLRQLLAERGPRAIHGGLQAVVATVIHGGALSGKYCRLRRHCGPQQQRPFDQEGQQLQAVVPLVIAHPEAEKPLEQHSGGLGLARAARRQRPRDHELRGAHAEVHDEKKPVVPAGAGPRDATPNGWRPGRRGEHLLRGREEVHVNEFEHRGLAGLLAPRLQVARAPHLHARPIGIAPAVRLTRGRLSRKRAQQ
mmetsp:Transcript_122770/g.342483  ORF Transcript_122770/g.342483 Transcript_122770/m.342483 type:complete len:281 (+) Transcript_122770:59-901(+)